MRVLLFSLRFIVPLGLLLLLSCSHNKERSSELDLNLSDTLKDSYASGRSLVLYSYESGIQTSEAFSDWEHYRKNFEEEAGRDFSFTKVSTPPIPLADKRSENYTFFIKKGRPVYFYDGLIVEPQVYTSVKRLFSNQALSDMDKAFLPEKLDVNPE